MSVTDIVKSFFHACKRSGIKKDTKTLFPHGFIGPLKIIEFVFGGFFSAKPIRLQEIMRVELISRPVRTSFQFCGWNIADRFELSLVDCVLLWHVIDSRHLRLF